MVCLNENAVNAEGDKLINMLSTLLSKSINSNDNKKILSEEFKMRVVLKNALQYKNTEVRYGKSLLLFKVYDLQEGFEMAG